MYRRSVIFSILLNLTTAHAADQINLGLIASLTGYGATAGISTLNGATLAVEEINAAGGASKKAINLSSEDNQSDPKQTISAFHKLKTVNKISAIVGPNWSEFAEPLATVANANLTLMITPTGHTPTLLKNKPYVFSLLIPAKDAIKPFANYILNRKFSEVIIVCSQNVYYEMLSLALIENLQGKVKVSQEFVDSQSLDYRSTISKLRTKNNLGIVSLLLENGPISTFVKQAKSVGIKPENLLLGPVIKDDEVLRNNPMLANGLIYFDYVFSIPEDFDKKYKARFNEQARYDSTLAYDAVYMIKNAIEKCGEEPEGILKCIPDSLPIGQSGPIKFDSNRDRILDIPVTKMFRMENGKSVALF